MNRLLITILLVLAFAVSFAQFAHAQDSTTPTSPADGTGSNPANVHKGRISHPKPKLVSANVVIPAAPTQMSATSDGTPLTPDKVPLTVKDICGSDADCGTAVVKLSDDKESKLKADVIDGKIQVTQVCATCDGIIGYQPVEADIPQTDTLTKNGAELKSLVAQTMDDASKLIKELARAQATLKLNVDACIYTEDSKVEVINGKVVKTFIKYKRPKPAVRKVITDDDSVSDDDLDADVELTDIQTCQENNLEKFADSEDPIEQKAVSKIMASFQDRLSELAEKAAMGTISKDEMAEYAKLSDFQTKTILTDPNLAQVAADYLVWKVQNEQKALASSIQQADQLKKTNPAAAAQILANLNNGAAAKYKADILLASTAIGTTGGNLPDYQKNLAYLNSVNNDPQDLLNSMAKISKELPASAKTALAGGAGTFSSILAQDAAGNSDSSTVESSYNKNLKEALRIANSDLGTEALIAALDEKEPTLKWNSSMSSIPAHFKVGSLGTGLANSQINPVSPAFTNSNMVSSSVANQTPFGNNFGNTQANSFSTNTFQPTAAMAANSTVNSGNGFSVFKAGRSN